MNRGMCASCKNMSEVHRGNDGNWYCEDCLRGTQPSPPVEGRSPRESEAHKSEGPLNNKRDEYLKYIICHVTDEWIDDFLEKLKREWKRSYGWLNELRKMDDNMKLLRLASELGYGKETKHKPSLNYDVIADVGKLDGVIEGKPVYSTETKSNDTDKGDKKKSGKKTKKDKKSKTKKGTGRTKKKKKS